MRNILNLLKKTVYYLVLKRNGYIIRQCRLVSGIFSSQLPAEVVKLVDTLASGASGGNPMEVQVLSSAFLFQLKSENE